LPSPVPRAPEAVQRESGPSKAPEGQQATKRRSDTRALTRVETRGDAPVAAPPASSSLQQAVSPPTPVAQQLPRALPLPPRPAQSSSSGKPDPAAADLTARVEKALAAAPEHVEVAVGLYQAAAARYGEEQPALVPLRRALAENGAIRVREMLSAGRCAQAQALYRALNGIQAASDARRLFGQRCPAP
jgi:hypothetical protein